MWFRRRRAGRGSRALDRPFVRPPAPEPIVFADARDEGILVAEYAARMQLKNRIIVDVLSGGGRFEESAFDDDAREVLDRLSREMIDAADRLADQREVAESLAGKAQDMHDYRRADTANLELRERVCRAVATERTRRANEPDDIAALIGEARADAWDDVSRTIGSRLDLERGPSAVDATYERTRDERMRLVKNVDLARLAVGRFDY